MNKETLEKLEQETEKRIKARGTRKRRRMKTSGAGVKELQRLIAKK